MSDINPITNPLVTKEDVDDHNGITIILRRPDGKMVVFFHEKYQFFTLPVGKYPTDGDLWFALVAEAFEEMGIQVLTYKLLGSFNKTYDRGNGISTTIHNHVVEVLEYENVVRNCEPDKHPIMMWLSESDIAELASKRKISDATFFYLRLKVLLDRECCKI